MKGNTIKLLRDLFRPGKDRSKSIIRIKEVDFWLAGTVILLTLIGIVMVYNSSIAIAIRDFSDQYYYLKEQLRGFALGLVLFSVFTFIDYHYWKKIALPLLVTNMALLLAVFVPGIGISALGAHRWIKILGFVIQPAELAKFTLIIYLSAWFSNKEKGRMIPFLVLIGMFVGLILFEPDMGTGLVLIAIALIMYFVAGSPILHFLLLIPLTAVSAFIFAVASPYRFQRLLTFLDPERDPLGASYQIRQALIAIGSGGITGVGLGMSRQKYEYLPEANTDSIFAVIAEETGFIGGVIMVLLFLFLIWRGMRVARLAPDIFGRLIASGIVGWVGIQAGLNISAMMAIMPLTGIPLPLISYGSSSLVILLAAFGVLLNISRHIRDNQI